MSDLETMIRSIVRSELKAAIRASTDSRVNEARETQPAPTKPRKQRAQDAVAKPTSKASLDTLTAGQKAARTRKLRAAGHKAWVTRRRNEAAAAAAE